MFKKIITYTDYDGVKREEECLFHLTKAEVIKWLTTSGDYTLDKVVDRLAKERNGRKIMEIVEDLIHRSYGVKSLDGRRFVKNDEVWNEFYETEAYSILFTELITDAKACADFVNRIIPADMAADIAKIVAENADGVPAEMRDYLITGA